MSEPKILNEETKTVSISTISEHPRNPNRNEISRIVESIEEDGFYGTITVQLSTGFILAGNHRYRAAVAAGLVEVPVTFVEVDDETALRILVKDNRLAELGHRDEEILAELLTELEESGGLEGTGYTDKDLSDLLESLNDEGGGSGGGGDDGSGGDEKDPNYERKVESPVYEPKSDVPPPIEVLANVSKADEILARIEAADIPSDVADFLRMAATRHIAFDYQEIAEYYSHASAEVQSLFEDSALVIIDFEDAIEKGFVKLVGDLAEAYDAEQSPEGEE